MTCGITLTCCPRRCSPPSHRSLSWHNFCINIQASRIRNFLRYKLDVSSSMVESPLRSRCFVPTFTFCRMRLWRKKMFPHNVNQRSTISNETVISRETYVSLRRWKFRWIPGSTGRSPVLCNSSSLTITGGTNLFDDDELLGTIVATGVLNLKRKTQLNELLDRRRDGSTVVRVRTVDHGLPRHVKVARRVRVRSLYQEWRKDTTPRWVGETDALGETRRFKYPARCTILLIYHL